MREKQISLVWYVPISSKKLDRDGEGRSQRFAKRITQLYKKQFAIVGNLNENRIICTRKTGEANQIRVPFSFFVTCLGANIGRMRAYFQTEIRTLNPTSNLRLICLQLLTLIQENSYLQGNVPKAA